jgi:hypothetical protein
VRKLIARIECDVDGCDRAEVFENRESDPKTDWICIASGYSSDPFNGVGDKFICPDHGIKFKVRA